MKKGLLIATGVVALTLGTSVEALEIPNTKLVKPTTTSSTQNKSEKEAAVLKNFQNSLTTANTKFSTASKMADNAIWALGDIILDKSVMTEFKSRKAEPNTTKEVLNALNTSLKAKDFDESVLTQNNQKYVSAVTNLRIANNRYENIMNNMSPNFKKILDGDASMVAARTQLLESGKLTKNVQATSMGQRSLLRKLDKINERNSINITIPANEAVVYNKDGVIGSINYSLDSINADVKNAYSELITAFHLKDMIQDEISKIEKDNNLSKEEKKAKCKKVVADTTAKALGEYAQADADGKIKELSLEQKKAILKASTIMTKAVTEYGALGLTCTKLGMKISAKPILAAPMAIEIGQLKYTAKILGESASSLKKVSAQVIKIKKANNIKTEKTDTQSGKSKKVNLPLGK